VVSAVVAIFALVLAASRAARSWLARHLGPLQKAVEALLRGERPAPSFGVPSPFAGLARAVGELDAHDRETLSRVTREKERLQAVLQGMAEGVLVLDEAGRVLLANPRIAELFGSWGPVEGHTPLEVIRRVEVDETLARAGASAEPVSCAIELPGEPERHVQMHAVRFPREGEPIGTVAVFHDLSELRRLEGMRQEFMANVSHELKTPLTAIRGFAETLQDGSLVSEQRAQYVDVILRHADRLTALIDDLLELSRIEGRRQPLRAAELSPVETATALVRDLKPRFEARGLEVRVEGSGEIRAWADRRAVEQVLLNLLDNAIKYTEPGGRVALEIRELRDRIHVAVRDSGVGIPEEDLPRVFERFYRVDKARSRDLGGTGLGLSIVKHLVQAMDGDVDVESREGEGTVFQFSLPRAQDASDNVTPS
jgi:two-component system phosphate regulon sensor histidine kinase PhoR